MRRRAYLFLAVASFESTLALLASLWSFFPLVIIIYCTYDLARAERSLKSRRLLDMVGFAALGIGCLIAAFTNAVAIAAILVALANFLFFWMEIFPPDKGLRQPDPHF